MSQVVWAWVVGATAACMQASCGELLTPLCGSRVSSTLVVVSESGCEEGEQCTVAGFIAWASGTTSNFSCTAAETQADEVGIEWSYAPCVLRREKQGWKNCGSVLLCQKDEDCLKEDATYDSSACVCVPRSDSKGVCVPDPSNLAIFSHYWDSCNSGNNQIMRQEEYQFWAFVIENWVYLQSDLTCVRKMREFGEYARLLEVYSGGGGVAACLLLIAA